MRNTTIAESLDYYWANWREEQRKKEEEEEEEDPEMEAYRIEMEEELEARLEEDMERMREMYFD